jgi:23S rRNA (pseudouridine1915-N3)-methyltransferase
MRIRFVWIGRTKNSSVKALVSDYLERIRRLIPCEIVEARDSARKRQRSAGGIIEAEGEELARHLPEHGRLVALDEKGSQYTSAGFARWLESEQNEGARVITFVIGGPDGLSPRISGRAHFVLSLGTMTWTHEMCRVLLLEQVYRALCILRRIPYHKSGNPT